MKYLYRKLLPQSIRKWFFFVRNKKQRIRLKYSDILIKKYGYEVLNGPFKDMHYISQAVGSSYITKLIGCYEEPLHPFIEGIKKDAFDTIIDIGTAEGYYLIGLGRFFPDTNLIGYDVNPKALDLVKKLARANNLKNKLHLDSECTHEKLNEQITENTLLICDAEGFEKTILNPDLAPNLLRVKTMVIEMHDHKMPGVKQALTQAFKDSHSMEFVHLVQATASNYSFLQNEVAENHVNLLLKERTTEDQYTAVLRRLK